MRAKYTTSVAIAGGAIAVRLGAVMKATLGLAARLVLPATDAFAAGCDRNDFA
jgi:hypothetical protein